jgi:GST-like protein
MRAEPPLRPAFIQGSNLLTVFYRPRACAGLRSTYVQGTLNKLWSKQMASQTTPIELHYWPTPNGHKISIMLEELGVPYEVKYVNIGRGEQFEPAFLKISPNNRMPAIVDPEGPDGKSISVFESGAILQYLGRKFGKFYPADERARVQAEEWLFWQMGGLGPMAGQAHHFRQYAPEQVPYAIDRYTNEVNRLYGVLNKRLAERDYLAGDYSIADMAAFPWTRSYEKQGQKLDDFPHMKRWFDTIAARPAVQRGLAVGQERRSNLADDKDAQKILFGQKARG